MYNNAAAGAHQVMEQRKKREEKKNKQEEFFQAAATGDNKKITHLIKERIIDIEEKNSDGSTALFIAAEEGHDNIVRQLITAGATFDKENKQGDTPLLIACQNGHLNVVTVLIEKKASASKTNKEHRSPVCVAALGGHEEIVQYLVQKAKVDVNAKMLIYDTPLDVAIKKKNVIAMEILLRNGIDPMRWNYLHLMVIRDDVKEEIIETLIKGGFDINKKNHDNLTPLHIAAMNGYSQTARTLLKHNADPTVVTKDGDTALSIAIKKGHEKVVEILLDEDTQQDINRLLHLAAEYGQGRVINVLLQRGAKVDQENEDGITPLTLAANKGHAEAMEVLIKNGADVNKKINKTIKKGNWRHQQGATPLYRAAVGGHTKVVQLLLDNEADVNLPGAEESTPIGTAAAFDHTEVVELLLRTGKVDINEGHPLFGSPLYRAAGSTNSKEGKVVTLLLKLGADVNQKGPKGRTALHIASWFGNKKVIEELLNSKADVDCKDQWGNTPLHTAAERGHDEVVAILLSKGKASIDERNDEAATPLHIAAQNGHEKVVEELSKGGVDLNQVDGEGRTCLWLACINGHLSLITSLLKHKVNVEQNKELLEKWRATQKSNFSSSIQKNIVVSATKIALQHIEQYEKTGGGGTLTKQNETRASAIQSLKKLLNEIKNKRKAQLEEVIQALKTEQEYIIKNKLYGWRGYKYSEYYQALEKSLLTIEEARNTMEFVIGKLDFSVDTIVSSQKTEDNKPKLDSSKIPTYSSGDDRLRFSTSFGNSTNYNDDTNPDHSYTREDFDEEELEGNPEDYRPASPKNN